MTDTTSSAQRSRLFRDALETVIRVGLVLLLLLWCLQIARPFLTPILWGVIIAIAVAPAFRRFAAAIGDRPSLAATLFVLLALAVFIAPMVTLSGALIDSIQEVADSFRAGELRIPQPPEAIAQWPLVGARISALWGLAASNLDAAVTSLSPQLKAFGAWLLAAAANVGLGILQFIFSVIIAGIVLANGQRSHAGIERLMRRLAGENGLRFVTLSESTVRSVATGILGVALIQSILAGVGLVVAGVPAAGLWAVVVLFLCVIQLGPALVMLPATAYLFYTAETLTAVIFLVFSIFVGVLDNILKPLLLGRGVDAPMLVIFIGAIGGFLSMGIIGLFVGAVVFVLFYTLLKTWVSEETVEASPAPQVGEPPRAA
jgi:predicted PurR-regulated permease PerM